MGQKAGKGKANECIACCPKQQEKNLKRYQEINLTPRRSGKTSKQTNSVPCQCKFE